MNALSPAVISHLTGGGLDHRLCRHDVIAAGLAGHWYGVARLLTALSGAALLWAWFVAQAPRLIGTRLTIRTAAAMHPALVAIAIAIVLLLVLPATYLLFALFERPVLEVTE